MPSSGVLFRFIKLMQWVFSFAFEAERSSKSSCHVPPLQGACSWPGSRGQISPRSLRRVASQCRLVAWKPFSFLIRGWLVTTLGRVSFMTMRITIALLLAIYTQFRDFQHRLGKFTSPHWNNDYLCIFPWMVWFSDIEGTMALLQPCFSRCVSVWGLLSVKNK